MKWWSKHKMPKVMLIEDDETMLSLLGMYLQLEGFEVAPYNDEEGLENTVSAVRREKPAIVLVDVHLRQFSGFDVLKQIRMNPDLQDIRVLMSSGMDFGSKCLEAGADGFVLKPYMPEELIRLMQHALGE
jgi:DNA-binding response OmpR family regulator